MKYKFLKKLWRPYKSKTIFGIGVEKGFHTFYAYSRYDLGYMHEARIVYKVPTEPVVHSAEDKERIIQDTWLLDLREE